MPIVMNDVENLVKFIDKKKRDKKPLGDLLAELGKKVEGANPIRDIRELREDEDVLD